MRLSVRLILLSGLLAVPGISQAAKTYGLVIGINDYQHVTRLDGARADAVDIAAALKRAGASRIIRLLDREADKQTIVDAWDRLLNEAEPGDTLFLSYAGHGAQVPERIKGEEKDGLDEFWVLPAFDPKDVASTRGETVFDNELNGWFASAAARGIRVVFISDSCHAGGMQRAVSGKLRFVDFGKERVLGELFASLLGSEPEKVEPEADLPKDVTMLAATSEDLPVPEVIINGEARGALSWSIARALEGMADTDANGVLTRSELEDYVYSTVRSQSEALQTPVFTPEKLDNGDATLMALLAEQPQPENENVAEESTPVPEGGGVGGGELSVATLDPVFQGGGYTGSNLAIARALGFEPAVNLDTRGKRQPPLSRLVGSNSFVWDASAGTLTTPNGDIAAEDIDQKTVDAVVEKQLLLNFLKSVSARHAGKITLKPVREVYLERDRIKFEPAMGTMRNMLVFNLANNGEVQYIDRVADGMPVDRTPLREMQVVAPFGADHLVAISTDQPLDFIGNQMRQGLGAKALLEILMKKVDFSKAAVAIAPIYTRQQ
ncbi:MAG: hypothetical protein RLZZ444_770 [Pseudomonadota bacterium]